MKILLRLAVLVLVMFSASCSDHSNDHPIGNGFFTRASGITFELHSANISLHLKDKNSSKLVWPSLLIGWGGTIPIENGILFVARNQVQERSVFIADEHGTVAEIISHIPGAGRNLDVAEIKKSGDKIQVDLYSFKASLTEAELMQLAKKVISTGEKVRLGKVEFYR
jgi:hypothetical protein